MNPFSYSLQGQGGDSELQQLEKIGNSTGGRNPVQDSRYKELLAQQGGGASGGNPLVQQAQQLNDYYKTANQPIVSSLQTQQGGLDQKYKDLVASIKGNQQLDTNRQTLATNNELGRRGLTTDSGLGAQELVNSLTPIDTQYSGLLANASAGSISDSQNLALQIAQLQAGNPESAVSGALNYGQLVNSANQIQSNNAYQSAQLAQNQSQFNSSQANSLTQQAIDNAYRQTAYNDSQKKAAANTVSGNAYNYLNSNTTSNSAYGSDYDRLGNLLPSAYAKYGVSQTKPTSFQPLNYSTSYSSANLK